MIWIYVTEVGGCDVDEKFGLFLLLFMGIIPLSMPTSKSGSMVKHTTELEKKDNHSTKVSYGRLQDTDSRVKETRIVLFWPIMNIKMLVN